jgi:DNA-binding response OmpR family regulator
VQLRTREYQILVTLATRLNQVVSRRELEEAVSPRDQSVESNTIEVFIHHLRRKLGNKLIETVRGAGYVIRA